MSDQQRWDTLGCYGCTAIPTPALDGLASDGVVFERCYVNVPICTPSRACMLTGRLPAGHGVYGIHDTLPADQVLVPEHLARLGYETALVGKLHVSGRAVECVERHPHGGFERYEWSIDPQVHLDSPFNAHAAWLREHHREFLSRLLTGSQDHHPEQAHFSAWAAERAVAFLEERDPARPFFLNVSLFDPHGRYFDYPLAAANWWIARGWRRFNPSRRRIGRFRPEWRASGRCFTRAGQGGRPAAPRHQRDPPRLPDVDRHSRFQ